MKYMLEKKSMPTEKHQNVRTPEKPVKDQSVKDQSAKDQSAKDQSAKDQSVKDQSVKDQSVKDQSVKDQSVKDQSVKDQSVKDQSVKDQAAKDQSVKGQPFIDRNAPTQIGQVLQGLGSKFTQKLPSSVIGTPQAASSSGTKLSREEVEALILALGAPEHPAHASSMEQLVEAGYPAIGPLKEVLTSDVPWLTAYRAAEALGRIGDGRATGALIQALRNPNSNVRWSAVRALAQIGDFRALLELRRVANEDPGRTSWGESVAGAAHSALDQIQAQSVWGQSMELIKTSITSVLMILSLIFAFSVFTTLKTELNQFGKEDPSHVLAQVRSLDPEPTSVVAENGAGAELAPLAATPAEEEPALEELPTPEGTLTPEEPAEEIVGKVLSGANVRPRPSVQNEPIGAVSQGDEIVFLGISSDGMWYHIRLGERHSDGSSIENEDGSESGWVHRELVSTPKGDVPVEDPDNTEDTEGTEADEETEEETSPAE